MGVVIQKQSDPESQLSGAVMHAKLCAWAEPSSEWPNFQTAPSFSRPCDRCSSFPDLRSTSFVHALYIQWLQVSSSPRLLALIALNPAFRVFCPAISEPSEISRGMRTLTNTADVPRQTVPDSRPIVISGPSGVGKGTLYGRLFQV